MNHAVEVADGNEFRLLYVIANTMSLKKEGHTKIYRDMLADKLGLSTKQITRLTNALVDKGLLKKDLVSENGKTVNYYSLNLDNIGQKSTSKVDKNVPLNKSKKNVIKEKKEIIDNKSKKKQFEIECKNEKIETNTEEIYVDKTLEKELEMAIEQNLIPTEEKKKVEVKKQFLQHCDNPIRRKQKPDVEELSQYLKRTRAYAEKTFKTF